MLFDNKGISLTNPDSIDGNRYFEVAKIIFEYCKELKDTKNETFPLFGIEQGILLFPLIVTDGDTSILGEFFVANENRNIKWYIENPSQNTRLFSQFSEYLMHLLTYGEVAWQMH